MLRTCEQHDKEGWSKIENGILFLFHVPLSSLLLGTLENPYNPTRQFEAGSSNQILTSSDKRVTGESQKLPPTKPEPTMHCKNQAASANHIGTEYNTQLVSII